MLATMDSKKINVLFLSAWYPNKFDPMPGLFVKYHAIAVSAFCNVSVIYVHADKNLKEPFQIENNTAHGINEIIVYYKGVSTGIPLISQFIKTKRYFKAFLHGYKYLLNSANKPDLVHVNILTRTAAPALYLKKKYNIPFIITEHWSRYLPGRLEYKGFARKFITEKAVKNAFAITTVTENLKNAMIACGLKHHNYQVIPNVVDTSRFIPENLKPTDKKIITHISCFDEAAKNVKAIVRLAKNLSKTRDDFEIHLIGDGSDKQMVYQYAREIGVLDTTIFFKGLLEDKHLVDAINFSAFTILFSNYENFPVVIPESLSCGIPVLSSDIGGIAEHLTPDLGILVPPGNEDLLLEKANHLLDHYQEFDKEHLRNYAENHYSYHKVGEAFYAIYHQAVQTKSHE